MTLFDYTQQFWRGLLKLPLFWQSWIHFVIFINLGGGCLFWKHELAQWVVVSIVVSFFLGLFFLYIQGFTKLLGLMYFPLFLSLVKILSAYETISIGTPFGLWLRLIIITNSLMMVMSLTDIIKYCLGDHTDLLV